MLMYVCLYTCGHILWGCIAIGTHDPRRDVAFAIEWPVLGQPEIRKLRVVALLVETSSNVSDLHKLQIM